MKFIRLALLTILTLCSGCIKYAETVTLNEDGSGTIAINYSLPEDAVTQISGMMKLADQLAQAAGETPPRESNGYLDLLLNPSESRIQKKIESYAISGLTLKESKVESRDGSRFITLILAFTHLSDIAQTDFFADHGFSLTRTGAGNYRLERKGSPIPSDTPVDLNDPEIVRQLTPTLGGFEATISVKTPARILEANTTRRSLRQAMWKFEFNRDPADFRDFYTKDLIVVFDGQGLDLTTR